MMDLTPKQRECWKYLIGYRAPYGSIPTYRKIMVAMHVSSTSIVARLLKGMESRGYIRLTPGKMRSIELLAINNCPHCGHPMGSTYCRESARQPARLSRNSAQQVTA